MTFIKFGTDGWRALMAREFTFDSVALVSRAFVRFYHENGYKKGVAVSYDTRFLSRQFAAHVAGILQAAGIPVLLSDTFLPTPVLSHAVAANGLDAGIMITASHNPPEYNGIKFKSHYGGPAQNGMTSRLQQICEMLAGTVETATEPLALKPVDFTPDYRAQVMKLIRPDIIKNFHARIVYDAMHGAGRQLLPDLLTELGMDVLSLHAEDNPGFGGTGPEPVPANLVRLSQTIREQRAVIGIATDGDADRFAILDENGAFVQLHDLLPLLFEYLVTQRGWRGTVVRSTSMTDTVDRMASKYGIPVEEVPVGFKNISDRMVQQEVVIGGEESGGFGYGAHLPERDGLLSALLFLELVAWKGLPVSKLVSGLRSEYGPFAYERIDHYFPSAKLRENMDCLRNNPPDCIANLPVKQITLIDGIKFYLEQDAWMLMRVSDTEPLGRIYCAARDLDSVRKLLTAGQKLLFKN
jgi:phosphomannomutase